MLLPDLAKLLEELLPLRRSLGALFFSILGIAWRLWLVRIPGQGGRDSGVDPVSIPKLIRARFRDESGQGFRF